MPHGDCERKSLLAFICCLDKAYPFQSGANFAGIYGLAINSPSICRLCGPQSFGDKFAPLDKVGHDRAQAQNLVTSDF